MSGHSGIFKSFKIVQSPQNEYSGHLCQTRNEYNTNNDNIFVNINYLFVLRLFMPVDLQNLVREKAHELQIWKIHEPVEIMGIL